MQVLMTVCSLLHMMEINLYLRRIWRLRYPREFGADLVEVRMSTRHFHYAGLTRVSSSYSLGGALHLRSRAFVCAAIVLPRPNDQNCFRFSVPEGDDQ
jgi:hypothetical protein